MDTVLFKKEHVYSRNDALQDVKIVGSGGSPQMETEVPLTAKAA